MYIYTHLTFIKVTALSPDSKKRKKKKFMLIKHSVIGFVIHEKFEEHKIHAIFANMAE